MEKIKDKSIQKLLRSLIPFFFEELGLRIRSQEAP